VCSNFTTTGECVHSLQKEFIPFPRQEYSKTYILPGITYKKCTIHYYQVRVSAESAEEFIPFPRQEYSKRTYCKVSRTKRCTILWENTNLLVEMSILFPHRNDNFKIIHDGVHIQQK
jgi:hypothetical protein